MTTPDRPRPRPTTPSSSAPQVPPRRPNGLPAGTRRQPPPAVPSRRPIPRPATARPATGARPSTPIQRPAHTHTPIGAPPTTPITRPAAGAPAPRPASSAPRRPEPGSKIKILVTDDSAIMRRLVSEALAADPAFEIVGTANNGQEALHKIDELHPDVVTLDIEMPVMNGLETLIPLRRQHPRLPVIMFSTLTEQGAHATLEALRRGASDYATKPSATNLTEGRRAVLEELAPKIKAFVGWRQEPPASIRKAVERPPVRRTPTGRVSAVVIGVSTGGPTALSKVWQDLPKTLQVPVFIVQHMPAAFTPQFARQLDALGSLPVVEAQGGEQAQPGHGYLAPGGRHMILKRSAAGVSVALNDDPPENSCRPAVDVMFRSAASVYGGNVLVVMLTGMGYDGLLGTRELAAQGAQIIAQDKETSVVWGMPGAIAEAGLTDAVLPLERIANDIVNRVNGRLAAAGRQRLGAQP